MSNKTPEQVVKSVTPKRPTQNVEMPIDPWTQRFNELCYKIFYLTEDGKEFLQMNEHRYFYGPTAVPGKDISWAHFNEGRNNYIRGLREGFQNFMTKNAADNKPKKVNRTRK